MQCYQTKTFIFAVAIEKETRILSAINVQGKKLHTTKPFNRLVEFIWIVWRHKCRKNNVEQVSQFFIIEKTIIILKIETFAKNNGSF